MTDRDDDLRDPRLDAAWRAASREEPSRALDDAIRAAARREVGAGPLRAADAKDIPEVLSPERWWWPLAAAATIGAIAVGVLQVVGHDKLVEPAADKAVVSDIPAGAVAPKQAGAESREWNAPPPEQAAKPVTPPPAPAQTKAAPAPAVAAQTPAPPPALRKDAAASVPREERQATNAAPPAAPAASAERAAPVAEPFPADAARPEAKVAQEAAAAPASAMPAPAGAPGLVAPKAETASAPMPARRSQERDRARGATPDLPAASAGAQADARAMPAPKLPPDEWIARIRSLRDDGRVDEAAKELAEFRAAYTDHERRLPPDLRDWKPAPR